jgi:hypothetical protein
MATRSWCGSRLRQTTEISSRLPSPAKPRSCGSRYAEAAQRSWPRSRAIGRSRFAPNLRSFRGRGWAHVRLPSAHRRSWTACAPFRARVSHSKGGPMITERRSSKFIRRFGGPARSRLRLRGPQPQRRPRRALPRRCRLPRLPFHRRALLGTFQPLPRPGARLPDDWQRGRAGLLSRATMSARSRWPSPGAPSLLSDSGVRTGGAPLKRTRGVGVTGSGQKRSFPPSCLRHSSTSA